MLANPAIAIRFDGHDERLCCRGTRWNDPHDASASLGGGQRSDQDPASSRHGDGKALEQARSLLRPPWRRIQCGGFGVPPISARKLGEELQIQKPH
jgi:hypothetical protein